MKTEIAENRDRVDILEEEVNKYLDLVEKVPLYPIDRYRLVYRCLRHLDILGYVCEANSKKRLIIKNYYKAIDIEPVRDLISRNYRDLRNEAEGIAMYDADRQRILFQFREMIFRFGIHAMYFLGTDELKLYA